MRDIDIRKELRSHLLGKFSIDDPDCIVRDELGICQGTARIDIAVINGHLHGYEIKSEEDTLRRLPGQLETYTKVFDYLTFVTNEKHMVELMNHIPAWCGVIIAEYDTEDSVVLTPVRSAKINKSTDPHSIVQLLWRDEAIQILRQLGIQTGIMSKPRKYLWDTLATTVSKRQLGERVRSTIKKRGSESRFDQGPRQGGVICQQAARL